MYIILDCDECCVSRQFGFTLFVGRLYQCVPVRQYKYFLLFTTEHFLLHFNLDRVIVKIIGTLICSKLNCLEIQENFYLFQVEQ